MLILKDIAKDYQAGDTKVEALRGISCSFEPGRVYAIMGSSIALIFLSPFIIRGPSGVP